MTETLQIIYLVCGITAMLAATAAMTTAFVRSAKEIKYIRKKIEKDAELLEYQKKTLERIAAQEEVIKTIDDGEEQQDEKEQ